MQSLFNTFMCLGKDRKLLMDHRSINTALSITVYYESLI